MWYANPERKRAFKQSGFIKSRDVVVLVNEYGAEWEETPARLESNGYHAVQRRPSYASAGGVA